MKYLSSITEVLKILPCKLKKNEFWEICLGIFVAFNLSLYYLTTAIKRGISLDSFSERIIGSPSLYGVDPNQRTDIFLLTIAIFCIFYIVFSRLLRYFLSVTVERGPSSFSEGDKNNIALLSMIAVAHEFIFIYNSLNGKQPDFYPSAILIALLFFVVTIVILKSVSTDTMPVFHPLVLDNGVLLSSFIVPVSLIVIFQVITDQPIHVSYNVLVAFLSLQFGWLGLWYLLLQRCHKKRVPSDLLSGKLILSMIPISLIPLSIPLANEIQFSISGVSDLAPRTVSLSIIALLFLLSWIPYTLYKRQVPLNPVDSTLMIRRYLFPVVIATCALYSYYQHELVFNWLDMFQWGENILPIQEMVKFHQIPYVDFCLPHGLYDIFPQVFYVLFNGYSSVEILIWGAFCAFYELMWGWGIVVFGCVMIYFLLSELFDSWFSFVIVLFFPVGMIFPYYYAVLIIPILFLAHTLKNPTFKNFLLLWTVLVFMFLWRVDFGVACMAGTMFMLFFSAIEQKWANIKSIFVSMICIAAPLVILYAFLLFIKDKSIAETLQQIFFYFKIQVSAHSFPEIYTTFNSLVVFQYFIIPLICILYIIYYITDRLTSTESVDRNIQILTTVAIICLIFSIRSLHRHSLIERYFPYFIALLLCCLPILFKVIKRQARRILFIVLFLCYYLIFPNHFPYTAPVNDYIASSRPITHYLGIIPKELNFTFKNWKDKESRVIIKRRYQVQNIVSFLGSYLREDQTFIDFSNSTMLYVFSGRKYPLFIMENLNHASDVIQKNIISQLDALKEADKVPIVVFKQGAWFDHIDDIPNEVRCYRIAEWIYENYYPLGKVDNYELWAAKDHNEPELDRGGKKTWHGLIKEDQSGPVQQFDLKKLPYIWATFDDLDPIKHSRVLDSFNPVQNYSISPQKPFGLKFEPIRNKKQGTYLHLRLKTWSLGTVNIEYGQQEGKLSGFKFSLLPTGKEESYLIRLSSQWQWYAKEISSLRITTNSSVDVVTIQILEGD